MKKAIFMTILYIGILLVVIGHMQTQKENIEPKIVYRYIPRSFEEEQNNPIDVSDIFKTLFNEPSPWIASISNIDHRKQEDINKYFISQV